MKIRSYSELIRIPDFEGRFEYLKLSGTIGKPTFGYERFLNQSFYTSSKWRALRREILIRDGMNDMGCEDYPLADGAVVHHINPLGPRDIEEERFPLYDPENLISVAHNTHNAIHYGDKSLLPKLPIERRPGDTILW